MLSLPNMMNLFAHELAGLGGCRLTFFRILTGSSKGLFFQAFFLRFSGFRNSTIEIAATLVPPFRVRSQSAVV
jgi:hypothetical protein